MRKRAFAFQVPRVVFVLPVFTTLLSGCAHQGITERNPEKLLSAACLPGASTVSVSGSAWLKAASTEASGQFPAVVQASRPDRLRLEVTNLLGGTEAVITVKDQRYSISGKSAKSETGEGSWGGIPLFWATELFLGKIPCPSQAARQDAALKVGEHGDLTVETRASLSREPELFHYRFRNWGGKPWPESLHWERKNPPVISVDFSFDDPEDPSGSPKKWEAKSQRGEVKVRWKDRVLKGYESR